MIYDVYSIIFFQSRIYSYDVYSMLVVGMRGIQFVTHAARMPLLERLLSPVRDIVHQIY